VYFTAFTLSGLGMAKHATTHKEGAGVQSFVVNGLSGVISLNSGFDICRC